MNADYTLACVGLLVIGATNRPDCIDAALMRPGRFDRILFVDLPTEADRIRILEIHSKTMQLDPDVDLGDIAAQTPYFSGAELEVRDRLSVLLIDRLLTSVLLLPECLSRSCSAVTSRVDPRRDRGHATSCERCARHHASVVWPLDAAVSRVRRQDGPSELE